MSTIKNWDASVEIPTNSEYILRVMEAKFAPSNGGNPMITLQYEIASPDQVTCLNGEIVSVAGVKVPGWYVTKSIDPVTQEVDFEKTASCEARVFSNKENTALFQLFGITIAPNQYDNPPVEQLIGKCQYARIKPDAKVKHDSPTAADLKAGKKEGKVSINPKTRKPIQTYYPKIEELYGLAEVGGNNSPFA